MRLPIQGMRKYTLEQLVTAIKNNYSLGSVLTELQLTPAGGNYEVLKKAIEEYGLDTSHFTGKGWLKGKTHEHKLRPLDKILVEGKFENTVRLKIRLLKAGLKERRCENCGTKDWLGELIPLELHHEDGNRKNNQLNNLALLCPNCHAMTDNYRGKNKKVQRLDGHDLRWIPMVKAKSRPQTLMGGENRSGKENPLEATPCGFKSHSGQLSSVGPNPTVANSRS